MKTVDFLFEIGVLAKQKRTGRAHLGSGEQSIAEHINRVCYVGYVLASMDGTVDPAKVVMMCLFHDMAEARSLDHNYTAQAYVKVDEERIISDQTEGLPGGDMIKNILHEYHIRESQESKLAKDADYLELFLFLKEQYDTGNMSAEYWMDIYMNRMLTDVGKKLLKEIRETRFDNWRKAIADTIIISKDAKN